MRFPVCIEIKPSRRLRAALSFLHLLAIGAIAALALVWPLFVLAIPLVLVTGCRALASAQTRRFCLAADGGLTCDELPAEILPGTTVFVWLVVMRYRSEGEHRARNCVVLADSLPTDDFRRLRIWLRWIARA